MKIQFERLLNADYYFKGTFTFLVAASIMMIMPIYFWFLPPFMILWLVLWLLEIKLRISDFRIVPLNKKILFLLFIAFYLWQIIGMLYSHDLRGGWRNIVLRLSLFMFPLVLIAPGTKIRQKTSLLLKLFCLSTLTFLIICFGYALYRSVHFDTGNLVFNSHPPVEDWLSYFYGSEFAIFQHPSYLSMFAIFSAFISGENFFNESNARKERVIWLLISCCLLVAVYLLSSRAELFATIITIPVYLFIKFKITSLKKFLGLLLAVLLGFTFIVLPLIKENPKFRNYFNEKSVKDLEVRILNESRLGIWKSSLNLVKHNFIFGVGTGDIQDELNKEYLSSGDKNLEKGNNLNAHNQYLEILVEHGFIGLLLFLSVFSFMFYIAIREKNTLYLIFVIIIIVSFFFETMLNRLAGVSFFAVFTFLLLQLNCTKISTE